MANYALAKDNKILNVIVVAEDSPETLEGFRTYFEADEIFLANNVGPGFVKIDGEWIHPDTLISEETPLEGSEPEIE